MDMHSDATEQAEVAHSEMSARLVKAREDLAANEAHRHEIALATETGPGEAGGEPAAFAKAATTLRDNIEHGLVPAVAKAEQRMAVASFSAENEAKRQRATKARAVAARLAERGAVVDAALNQARQAYHALHNDLSELAALGAPTPSANLVDVNSRCALDLAIGLLHLRTRPIPPRERPSFDEICYGWSRPCERWAAEILDTAVNVNEAA